MMKNTNICPKCGSQDIIRVLSNPMNKGADRIPVGWTIFTAIPVTRYLCGACGYSEEWIDNPDDIERVRANQG